MKSPKVAVILFPGSNCELEALRAVRRSKMEAELIRWNDHSKKLNNYDAFILPGGFSYEDRGRSGVVASKDPIMTAVKKEAENGKPVLGICNGAQILVETGMIPGLSPEHLQMALAWNERIKNGKILGVGFYNDWVYIRHNSKPNRSVFNRFNSKILMNIPIAHGEGRFTTKDKNVLKTLIANDQTLFRYCNAKGEFIDEFPINPNGAMYNLAGVCNPQGNVMALMPHPERTLNGQPMFDSIASYLKSSQKTHIQKKKTATQVTPNPLEAVEKPQEKPDITMLIRLIITDNEERTIETTLKDIGYKEITLYRQIYLGFFLKDKKNLEKTAVILIESGEILNLNKEIPTVFIKNQAYSYNKGEGLQKIKTSLPAGHHVVAMEYDNYVGKSIFNALKNHEHLQGLQKIERGIHWTIKSKQLKDVIGTHIFHNPHSMKLLTV
jgi:phosphoribosylformylglycinamidine synthase subunit PurQ / glutaminase